VQPLKPLKPLKNLFFSSSGQKTLNFFQNGPKPVKNLFFFPETTKKSFFSYPLIHRDLGSSSPNCTIQFSTF